MRDFIPTEGRVSGSAREVVMDHPSNDNTNLNGKKDSDTRLWFNEGSAYLKAAAGKKKKFSVSILYNLLAMALEKFMMAALDSRKALPDNHTISDLIDAADRYCPLPGDLRGKLLSYEKYQMICSFADYFRTDELDESVIEDMRSSITELESWTRKECSLDMPA